MGRKLLCWNCGISLEEIPRPISRHEHCPQCFEALHCCRLCRLYDPKITGQCDDERADPPVQKENANFCDYFRPRVGAFSTSTAEKSGKARSQLDELFGGADADPDPDRSGQDAAADAPSSEDDATRGKLEALFSKETSQQLPKDDKADDA